MSFIRRFVRRPSHATVVAYMALFFAMSGTAYAAAKWTGTDIVDGSLTGADVAAGSLTGDDIAPGSITGTQLDPDALPSGGAGGASADTAETSELITWDQGFSDGYGNVV